MTGPIGPEVWPVKPAMKKIVSTPVRQSFSFRAFSDVVTHYTRVNEVLNGLLNTINTIVKYMIADRSYIHTEYRSDFTLSGPAEVRYVPGAKPGAARTLIGDEWKDSYRATMLLGHWFEERLTL